MFNRTILNERFQQSKVDQVWEKGKLIPGKDPDFWRKDTCGAVMYKPQYGQETSYGWEIDHIQPKSKGGSDDIVNLQPLQWENNRYKADNWPNWTCKNKS